MNVLSLFDGMSCGQLALTQLGFKIDNYFASEIDENAMKIAKKNFPNIKHIGDVTKVKGSELPKIDLLIGGSPCQGFSFAGKQLNFDDPRSALFFEFVRLLKETNPKYFLLENVRMKKESEDVITNYLGVKPILINSNLVSAQNRKRLYWTNIPNITLPQDKNILLKDVLDDEPFRPLMPFVYGYYGKSQRLSKMKTINTSKANCLTTSKSHTNQYYLNEDKTLMRNLSINEYEKLQTIPLNYTEGVIESQRYRMIGNGWTVDVIKHIFENLNELS
jgi:site-specific DNA-cytosine methylase